MKKAIEETVDNIKSEIKTAENNLRELTNLEKDTDNWQAIVNHQKELKLELKRTEQQFINMKNEFRTKKDELNVAIVTQNKLIKNIANLQQSQSELQTLLDNIERHIFNNICPVCGTLHKSREELVEKLRLQRGIQSMEIQDGLKLFEDEKVKADELKRQVDDMELKIKQLEQKIKEVQKELFDTEKRVGTYEERANLLNISINYDNLMVVIDSRKKS
ncbi:MAG: hypothetical protein QME42_07240 [bacterium]|nr:hypothetical protein [bacterium]